MPVTFPSRTTGLVEVIRAEAALDPDSVWCHFLPDGVTVAQTISRRELDDRCRRIALLLGEFIRPGDRVLVMCEPGIDYVAAFLGCLYAGAVAVPAYPPSPLTLERSLARLDAVVRDADPAYALTSRLLAPVLDGAKLLRRRDGSPVRHLCVDDAVAPADGWRDGALGAGDDIAMLQYTSGSTGNPKGVIVRHENLLANLAMITDTFGATRGSMNITWLPPYHDMGLVGLILWPLACGGGLVMMPPEAFLKRPENWVAAISRFGVRLTASPNFGYELAARRVSAERAAELDLSTFDVAINGAEPVSAATMEAFSTRFAPAGFRRAAFRPAYGLAEATLLVASARWGAAARTRALDATALAAGRIEPTRPGWPERTLTSSGRVNVGSRVRVVAPGGDVDLPDGQVGELIIMGPHVASGYWGLEAGTAGELRTGDLGCLIDDELLVTGRLKDLIVVRGRNHYPQDIERTAEEAHPGLRRGCAAAFSIDVGSTEALIIAAEVGDGEDNSAVAAAVTLAVSAAHGVRPRSVLLLAPRTIPKTSSGKLQRSATREAYLAGTLTPAARELDPVNDPALKRPA